MVISWPEEDCRKKIIRYAASTQKTHAGNSSHGICHVIDGSRVRINKRHSPFFELRGRFRLIQIWERARQHGLVERRAIHLPLRRERQRRMRDKNRRHHVTRQPGFQKLPQFGHEVGVTIIAAFIEELGLLMLEVSHVQLDD